MLSLWILGQSPTGYPRRRFQHRRHVISWTGAVIIRATNSYKRISCNLAVLKTYHCLMSLPGDNVIISDLLKTIAVSYNKMMGQFSLVFSIHMKGAICVVIHIAKVLDVLSQMLHFHIRLWWCRNSVSISSERCTVPVTASHRDGRVKYKTHLFCSAVLPTVHNYFMKYTCTITRILHKYLNVKSCVLWYLRFI